MHEQGESKTKIVGVCGRFIQDVHHGLFNIVFACFCCIGILGINPIGQKYQQQKTPRSLRTTIDQF